MVCWFVNFGYNVVNWEEKIGLYLWVDLDWRVVYGWFLVCYWGFLEMYGRVRFFYWRGDGFDFC